MILVLRLRIILAAASTVLVLAASALGGGNPQNKIAVHVIPHGATCKGLPSVIDCSQIQTTYSGTGDIDVIPVFYDLTEVLVVEFGLTWPAEWGTMAYTRCAGDLPIGNIVNPGDGIATAWTTCQRTWSVAHGYGWLAATGPGKVSVVPNPPTGDYGVVDCSPPPGPIFDYPAATIDAGIGGAAGDNPCVSVFLPLGLTKSDGLGGYCVSPGDTITYTITYSNAINLSDVHLAVLDEGLPTGITFISASEGGLYDGPAHKVTWALGTLAAGQDGAVQVVGRADAEMGATLTNTCTMVSDEAPASEVSTTTRICNQTYLPLGLAKDDGLSSGCVYRGDDLTYRIDFDNYANTGAVHNAVLVDYLPALTTFVSAGSGGTYSAAARTVTWQIGTLEPGAHGHRSLTLTANAPLGSTITNTCDISGDETPIAQAARHTSVCDVPTVFWLGKSDGLNGQCAYRGDTITYTLSYENTLDDEVTGVVLTDHLPQGTELVSTSSGGLYDDFGRAVTWTIGDLAARETGSQEVRARVTASPGSVMFNSAQIAGYQVPVATASRSTSVCGPIYRPLNLVKTASAGFCVDYGDSVTYTISYGNTANPVEVDDVVLTDVLPGQTEFVSASPGGVYDGGRVVWDLGTLAPGETGSQEVTVAVRVALGVNFTNRCIISSSGTPESEASKTLMVCGSGGRNPSHKIAVHVMSHPTACKAIPAFNNCGVVKTTFSECGEIDAIPVFYDLVEYSVVEFGLRWPPEWGTCEFTRCKGDIAVGGITNTGDGIAVAWTTCQYTWAVAAGVAWLAATGPGEISICPNPATGDMGVVNCAPSPGPYYDYPVATSAAGVCGIAGQDPCSPTKLERTTWGAIKAMFK